MKKDPELGAVERLTAGLEPPAHRAILVRCLSGTLSPAVALMQLLIETEDAAAVRAAPGVPDQGRARRHPGRPHR